MSNPIFDNINMPQKANINIDGIKQFANMYRNAQNPMAMLQGMMKQNPQIAQVMNMLNGRNPQEVFYSMCKERGVNPDDILSQFR